MSTLKEIKKMGQEDAQTWLNENPETLSDCLKQPNGWDESLINAIGIEAVCRLFGEDPAASTEGLSEAMLTKLQVYNSGAAEYAESLM